MSETPSSNEALCLRTLQETDRDRYLASLLTPADRRAAGNSNLIWTPAYTTLEASVTYQNAGWSTTLRGRNLLDEEYEEWATGLLQRLADPISIEFSLRRSF